MTLSINTPLSLYSIPIAYVIAFYPHNAKYRLVKSTVGWDNLNPRSHDQEKLGKQGMPKHLLDKAGRYAGAHQNGMETFPLWTAAILAANYAGVEESTLNIASAMFIGFRLLYNWIYINQTTGAASGARSLSFFGSIGTTFYLLIKAGNKLRLASGA